MLINLIQAFVKLAEEIKVFVANLFHGPILANETTGNCDGFN
jgi:hypothetical protein